MTMVAACEKSEERTTPLALVCFATAVRQALSSAALPLRIAEIGSMVPGLVLAHPLKPNATETTAAYPIFPTLTPLSPE